MTSILLSIDKTRVLKTVLQNCVKSLTPKSKLLRIYFDNLKVICYFLTTTVFAKLIIYFLMSGISQKSYLFYCSSGLVSIA